MLANIRDVVVVIAAAFLLLIQVWGFAQTTLISMIQLQNANQQLRQELAACRKG